MNCATRPSVIAVCKIFHIDDSSKLVIDIVSDEGKTWTKGKNQHIPATPASNNLKWYF